MMLQKQHVAWMLAFLQTFEVASVKPSAGGKAMMKSDPGRIGYSNVTLKRVLMSAYDVKDYQISAPEWLSTARFDITATFAEHTDVNAMLRDLLATRFKMTVHRESKELPIYSLVVAKNGPKIKPASSGAPDEEQLATMQKDQGRDGFPVLSLRPGGLVIETRSGRGRITGKEIPIAKLADLLSGQVGRPVFDMTELAGKFSFSLYFSPDGAGDEPPLFAALQEQLGLRLDARKGPVELLVIDHVERVPTEN
jgi:uncharacterized protein (TIGR03435 family)